MKFLPPESAAPLDPGSYGMLNAPFMGAGIKPACGAMPGTGQTLVVYSNEEDPTHGESADA